MDRKKMIVGAVAVIAAIGIIIYALVHSSSTAPSSSPKTPPAAPGSGQHTTQSKPPATPGNPSSSTPGVNSNGSLTDTGPGDIIALFIAASVMGYGLSIFHRLRTSE